jgi:hypothetical protein
MDKISNPIHALANLLSGRAQPIVVPERLAPSAIYDLEYRMSVIAAAFEIHAKPYGVAGQRRVAAVRLKLLQFVACRPWLTAMMREWSGAQHDAQLAMASSQRLRRGFLGDQMHEDVMEFLVARGVFVRIGSHIVSGNMSFLTDLYSASVERGLFPAERRVLHELLDVQITNAMLEGW